MSLILMGCNYYYNQNDCVTTFYDTQKEKLVYYKDSEKEIYPYFYTNKKPSVIKKMLGKEYKKVKEIKKEVIYNSLKHRNETFYKIIVDEPGHVGGENGIRDYLRPDSWQDAKKFYCVYTEEKGWNYGMDYEFVDGNPKEIEKKIEWDPAFKEVLDKLRGKYKDNGVFDFYSKFFEQSFPDIKVIGMDIEVENGGMFFPNPHDARFPITSISFCDSNNVRTVFMLKRKGMGKLTDNVSGIKVNYCKSEKQLLSVAMKFLNSNSSPVLLTYNGDGFDLPYLNNRMKFFRLKSPFYIKGAVIRGKYRIMKATAKGKLHFDLYRWFSNRSVMNYVYKGSYQYNDLDTVARTLIGKGKYGEASELVGLSYEEESKYVSRDTELLPDMWELTKNIVFLVMRFANVSFEDVSRRGINFWHSQLWRRELKRRNWIEPNKVELRSVGGIQTKSSTGKKFAGALVRAIPGVYVNCARVDFASLYPSIYEVWNLSWETINCECCSHRDDNRVPYTNNWVCKQRKGICGELYGFFKDIRVQYFKKIRDTSPEASNIEQGIKVFINSGYGVFGFSMFVFYCPPFADCTTAVGRYNIGKTWDKIEGMGLFVSQADTDSATLNTQDDEILNKIIQWSKKELQMDLEVEAKIKILIVYMRKNYLCIYNSGKIEIKGMTGKKKHTPQLFKDCFNEIVDFIKEEAIV